MRVTADGVVRNFTGIDVVHVDMGNGADTVTYNQGTATTEANLRRNFTLNVKLGDNSSGTTDRFTANMFGNVGFLDNGALQPRILGLNVRGNGGRDRISTLMSITTQTFGQGRCWPFRSVVMGGTTISPLTMTVNWTANLTSVRTVKMAMTQSPSIFS